MIKAEKARVAAIPKVEKVKKLKDKSTESQPTEENEEDEEEDVTNLVMDIKEDKNDAKEPAAFFSIDDPNEESQMQMQTSIRALKYLTGFFKDLGVDFKGASRADIEMTFKLAKNSKQESKLFKDFMDS